MRQGIGSALVQIMAYRLFGAKTLSKPILGDCQLDPYDQTAVEFWLKYETFHSRKRIWKYRLWNGGHFVQGGWERRASLHYIYARSSISGTLSFWDITMKNNSWKQKANTLFIFAVMIFFWTRADAQHYLLAFITSTGKILNQLLVTKNKAPIQFRSSF